MKKIKIVYSNYYFDELIKDMIVVAEKKLKSLQIDFDIIGVPGSFEIPFAIAKSIREDTTSNQDTSLSSFKTKGKKEIRDNIVQMAKLSQLNLSNKCLYSGYLALGCIIKGKTINHKAISTAIFTNLQRISIENNIPIGNGVFNANNLEEAIKKFTPCTSQAIKVLDNFIIEKEK